MSVTNLLDDNTTFWSSYYNALSDALAGFDIISGCSISKGTSDWDIDVTSGTVFIIAAGGGNVSVSSGTVTLTDPASDADMDAGESRIDLITANTSGTLAAVEGTAATNPDAPDVPADEVVLGFVVIAESDSTVADSDIIDIPALHGPQFAAENGSFNADSGPATVSVSFSNTYRADKAILSAGTSTFNETTASDLYWAVGWSSWNTDGNGNYTGADIYYDEAGNGNVKWQVFGEVV